MAEKSKSILNTETKKETRYKSYRERLSSKDNKIILESCNELITAAENYFQNNVFKYLCVDLAAREGVLPANWPLALDFKFPFIKKYLSSLYTNLINSKMQNDVFWGNINFTNTDFQDDTVKRTFSEILKKAFYADNNPYDYFVNADQQMTDFGYSIIIQDWIKETTLIDDVDIKIANEIRDKETGEIDKTEYEQISKNDERIEKNNMRIRALDIFKCRLDHTAKNPEDWRFFFHYLNLDYDTCVDKFIDFEKKCPIITQNNDETQKQSVQATSQAEIETKKNINYNQNSNIKIIEFWDKWGHRIYLLCSPETTTAVEILELKGVEKAMQNKNPYSHKKIPASIFYYKKNDDDTYASGAIREIYPLYILMIYLLSLSIIEEIKRVLSPIGIANSANADTTELIDAINGNSRFFNIEVPTGNRISDFIFQLQQNSTHSIFQLQQYIEGMIQAQLKVTDFQLGGVMNNRYNETLGGIEKIIQSANEQIGMINSKNKSAYKRLVKIAISLICQKLDKPIILQLKGKEGIDFIKIVKDIDSDVNSEKDFYQINQDKKITTYYLSDFMKLDIQFDIQFGSGSDTVRFAQLQKMLEISGIVFQAGVKVDIEYIVSQMANILKLSNVVKTTKNESRKVEKEEKFQDVIWEEYQKAIQSGILAETPTSWIDFSATYIPDPDIDDDDVLHLETHKRDTLHRRQHEYNLSKKQAQMEEMRAQMNQSQAVSGQADNRLSIARGATGQQLTNQSQSQALAQPAVI